MAMLSFLRFLRLLSDKSPLSLIRSSSKSSSSRLAILAISARPWSLTAVSASLAAHERAEAEEIARQIGARHILIESHETDDPNYLANAPNRCYFCKSDV